MLKINKFIKTAKTFPEITKIRYYTKDERCVKYDCKQPKADVDPREAELREMYIPQVFLPVHPPKPKLYKNIFLFVCLPAIICAFLNTLSAEEPKRPKFVEYAYLRLRTKEYPWDPVRTLFHNPRRNALPTGYEEEVPEDMEYNPLEEQCPHKK